VSRRRLHFGKKLLQLVGLKCVWSRPKGREHLAISSCVLAAFIYSILKISRNSRVLGENSFGSPGLFPGHIPLLAHAIRQQSRSLTRSTPKRATSARSAFPSCQSRASWEPWCWGPRLRSHRRLDLGVRDGSFEGGEILNKGEGAKRAVGNWQLAFVF